MRTPSWEHPEGILTMKPGPVETAFYRPDFGGGSNVLRQSHIAIVIVVVLFGST